ncbi:MAG: hypothetical protein AABX59_03405 [Nanoarchaeota archaeon]
MKSKILLVKKSKDVAKFKGALKGKIFCPVCKSHNITFYVGFITGNYQCKKCGYVGALVLKKK